MENGAPWTYGVLVNNVWSLTDDKDGGSYKNLLVHFGKLPVNTQLGAYYNVEKPEFGSDWQIRAQVQFVFRK